MKLYQSDASPNSRRVRIFLAEKGISMPIVPVDLAAKEQFFDAYAAINPRRVVPTLVLEDGTAIGEVPAILRYLEEIHPDPPLLGATPKMKALVIMWERRAELEGFAAVMEAVRNAVPGLKNRALPVRMITIRSRRWSNEASSASGISTLTSTSGSPRYRSLREMNSLRPTLPLSSRSTLRPRQPAFRSKPSIRR